LDFPLAESYSDVRSEEEKEENNGQEARIFACYFSFASSLLFFPFARLFLTVMVREDVRDY